MNPLQFFQNDPKKRRFHRYVDICGYMAKNYFKKLFKKSLFCNVDIADILAKKQFFQNDLTKRVLPCNVDNYVIFLEILIFTDLWTKN